MGEVIEQHGMFASLYMDRDGHYRSNEAMVCYKKLEDYGIIGNLETCALSGKMVL